MKALAPPDEPERLAALHDYAILDTAPEAAFERATRMAARLFKVPVAAVSLIDADRQWFKSCYGLDAQEMGRDLAFCAHAILTNDVTVVPDATRDVRFADNPLVTGPHHIHFYAGAPLLTPDGYNIGTLAIMDTAPRSFSEEESATLSDLAAQVMDGIRLRQMNLRLHDENAERRRAEAEVQHQAAILRAILDSAGAGIVVTDEHGNLVHFNPMAERILGIGASPAPFESWPEIYGVFLPDAVTPAPASQSVLAHAMRGEATDAEERFIRNERVPEGRCISITGRPLRDETGAVRGGIVVFHDITEHKRAEAALRESEERFRHLVEQAADSFFVMDQDARIVDANQRACSTLGYSREELLSLTAPQVDEDIAPEDFQSVWEHLRSGGTWMRECVYRRKDGTTLPVEARVSLFEAGGRHLMLALARDITERRQAEAALREGGERYRLLAENSLDLIGLLDLQGQILYASPSHFKVLGYEPEQLLHQSIFPVIHPDDAPGVLAAVGALLRGGDSQTLELRLRKSSGDWAEVEALLSVIGAPSNGVQPGDERRLLLSARDIAARKRAEENLKQAKEEAERAREEAERASRAKSEFLSRMSHELRTPMNAILGFGQLLEMEDLDEPQQQSVEHILKAGKHLLELINEVLDIARIEAGYLSLSLEPIHTAAMLSGVLDMARPLATARGIQLVSEAEPCERYVLADAQRLKQVLLNLVSNAIKYNCESGQVALTCEEVTDGWLRLKVRDTGAGLRPDEISQLFVPFERLGATQTSIEGTGIGLALCKGLAKAMGGHIGVESVVGQGSVFWVELLLTESPLEDLEEPSGAESFELAATSGKASTLLYIEDNLPNLQLIERVLGHRADVELLSAMRGEAGLDMARQHQPDVILLDVHLPDMMGDEVLRRLRAAPETRDIPVIVLSADATAAQIERLRAEGAADYLTKPLDVRKFLQVLNETLQDK